ncbi:TATA element modulatory factor [Musca vetustissima]|uniref:TATA element modulatory factor n=1 Tax=Musca vetustissima TaxID=27455 RepID=UPI002AB6DDD5|nr:TATA element modulatory factor [Musca vetustissima]
MSWFDTKNFAGLAKALKEAQKKIDKVLDIQEDDDINNAENSTDESNPFKEPPQCNNDNENDVDTAGNRRTSTASTLVSSVGTLSPQQITLFSDERDGSESVDVLPTGDMTSKSEVVFPERTTDSIVIIGSSGDVCADEENQASSTTTLVTCEENNDLAEAQKLDNLDRSKNQGRNVREDVSYDLQTIDSDSTQSFEDVQLNSLRSGLGSASEEKVYVSNTQSAHTSNDEMETATSSDIEIISNPSTTTRTSPQKDEKKTNLRTNTEGTTSNASNKTGHCREPSEISVLSIESTSEDEVEKLLRRISELNSIVEARELRLLQSEQRNSELQERNNELLAVMNADGLPPTEEYTKRLSALEKKFQNCIRERDALRTEIKELQGKIPKHDFAHELDESRNMVAELRQEGEKLSKEILQQSNIIKKLRSKEKNVEVQMKALREQLTATNEEIERLKKTLSAKEDVERTQIEAVHKMSSENQKLEKENNSLRSKLEDTQQKLITLQHSFEAVKVELQQRSKQHSDLSISKTAIQTAEKEKLQLQAENQELQRQLQEFVEKLRSTELTAIKKEQQLREENRDLIGRLEAAELRAESSTHEISQTTIPLMRHLESLQQTLNQRTNNWNREEKSLLEKLEATKTRLHSLERIEETSREQIGSLKSRCQELEETLSKVQMQEEKTKITLQLEMNQKETDYSRKLSELMQALEQSKSKIKTLEDRLDEAEHRLSASVESLQQEREQAASTFGELPNSVSVDVNRHSPTASGGVNSIEDGGSIDWQHQEDDFDCISNAGGRPVPGQGLNFHFIAANTTNNFEYLQSMLKQREGELAQTQWELSRVQSEKSILQEELTQLSIEMENIQDKIQSLELMEANYNDLQTRYDALLQMYGEKVERCEELEMDLNECKEAYKTQIQDLLKMKT